MLAPLAPVLRGEGLGVRGTRWSQSNSPGICDERPGVLSCSCTYYTIDNREDDPEYIVRLIGQVIRVSLETVKIVNSLPPDFEPK